MHEIVPFLWELFPLDYLKLKHFGGVSQLGDHNCIAIMTKLCHNVYDHKILYDFNNAENQTFLYKVIALAFS